MSQVANSVPPPVILHMPGCLICPWTRVACTAHDVIAELTGKTVWAFTHKVRSVFSQTADTSVHARVGGRTKRDLELAQGTVVVSVAEACHRITLFPELIAFAIVETRVGVTCCWHAGRVSVFIGDADILFTAGVG